MEKRKPERRDRTAAHRPAAGGRKRAVLGAIQKNRDKREKGTDVNIASHMLVDAADDLYDCAILISGDSDLTTPVKICIGKYGKSVGVLNPQKQKCQTLAKAATFYKHIRESALAASQFPTVLTDSLGTFHKPPTW